MGHSHLAKWQQWFRSRVCFWLYSMMLCFLKHSIQQCFRRGCGQEWLSHCMRVLLVLDSSFKFFKTSRYNLSLRLSVCLCLSSLFCHRTGEPSHYSLCAWMWWDTHGSEATHCLHAVQENEAGTVTSLQLWPWGPDGRIYTAEMPTSADSKNRCVANGSPATHQTLRQQGGTGEDSHSHLADWTQCCSDQEEEEL